MNCAAKRPPVKLEGAGNLMYNNIAEFMGHKEKDCACENISCRKIFE